MTFGSEAKVYLFGSRLDDDAHGGDIDIFIETILEREQACLARLDFLVDIQKRIGEQKIDVIVYARGNEKQAIHLEAKKTGVLL